MYSGLVLNLRLREWTIVLLSIFVFATMTNTFAQDAAEAKPADAKQAEKAKADVSDENEKEAEEKDPFEVPEEANAKELFEFIGNVKTLRGRTLQSVMKSAKAVVAGAQAIRELDGLSEEDETRAIKEQVEALTFLSQFDEDAKNQMKNLIDELKDDARPEIARIAAVQGFKSRISSATRATAEEQEKMVSELRELVGDSLDREVYGLGASLARAIGASENNEIAAKLYEEMSTWMAASDDEKIRERADKMLGSARRIRLPGNFMEVVGQTADGKEFDWSEYRGKVVLVDFWASWCGPCRAEVPNMKRNLQAYADRGFAIVGVNMDRTTDAYEKYVAKEEIPWVNLMSDKPEERGWDNPLASHYGVSAIPTAILVDQEGKVVSLNARGKELDRLLVTLLGEPAAENAEANESDAADEKAEKGSDS